MLFTPPLDIPTTTSTNPESSSTNPDIPDHEWPYGATDIVFSGPKSIEGLEGKWYVAGPFHTNQNSSYAIRFHEVTFIFLHWINHDERDTPYPLSIRIEFGDSTEEQIEIQIGGNVLDTPYSYNSTHSNLPASIVSHNGTSTEEWYGWYYLVSA